MHFVKKTGAWRGVLFIAVLMLVHYCVLLRGLFSRSYMLWGDTYRLWSFRYLALLSLKQFGELPWWDPTMCNGFPAYYVFLAGWSGYLSPFYIPSLAVFRLLGPLLDIGINGYLLFHQTVYTVLLIVIALYLISKELCSRTAAAFLPPVLFCFSYFPLVNFADYFIFDSIIAPLFCIYGLVRFNNNRNSRNLLLLLLFVGLLSASLCMSFMRSAFFWLAAFAVLVLACDPGLPRDTRALLGTLWKTRRGKILFTLGVFVVLAGLTASYLPVRYNSGRILRYRGGGVDLSFENALSTNTADYLHETNYPIEKSKIWTVLSNWLPFPDYQKARLNYGWDGHDHRYIGILTIPLILIALIYSSNRYVVPLLLTYCVCNAWIIYSTDNLVYRILLDHFDLFRNVTDITTAFSRGGASLFLILLSGVGLDALLNGSRGDRLTPPPRPGARLGALMALLSLVLMGIVLMTHQAPLQAYETSFHVGWYLALFSGICAGMLLAGTAAVRRRMAVGIFVLAFLDLTISLSAYIDTYARKPWDDGGAIPDTVMFCPLKGGSGRMFPDGYAGLYHNPNFSWDPAHIDMGKKEWLFLATTPGGQRYLENWDATTARMTEYPAFRFVETVRYAPMSSISAVGSAAPAAGENNWYVHDEELAAASPAHRDAARGEGMHAVHEIRKYTFNEVVVETATDRDGYLCFLDNYDGFWSAFVDGKETKVYPANYTFKLIKLPKGAHVVRWVFNPYPVRRAYTVFYILLAVFLLESRGRATPTP